MRQQIPLRDFFRNAQFTNISISPDGKYIAFLAPYQNRRNVFVQSVDSLLNGAKIGETAKRLTEETDRDIAGAFWGNINTILYLRDKGGDENFHIYSVNIGENENSGTDLTPFDGVQANILDTLYYFDDEILITLNKKDPRLFDVYKLNVATGKLQLVAENPGNVGVWKADHEGKLRLAITTDGVNQTILYRDTENEDFTELMTLDYTQTFTPSQFSFCNKYIYCYSNLNHRNTTALVKYDPTANKEVEKIFQHDEVDVGGPIFSKKSKTLQAIYYTTDKTHLQFYDDTLKKHFNNVFNFINDEEVELDFMSRTKDEKQFIFAAGSDKSAADYYYYNTETEKVQFLASTKPWLPKAALASMQPVEYTSRDGITIPAYLTLPQGVSPKNLPVVINPHGGPWHRDVWGFNPEVQFLANRGYAVLQPNFRGSTGYGKEFWKLSFGQWGLNMQNDITDGVQWLIDQGIADPKRIAIYGASYGGYATLAGITFTPELYACAIDYVGVSNMFTFLSSFPPYWEPFKEMMYEMVGHPEKDEARLRATSPLFHIDNIQCPLFVAQGAKDPRVKKAESDQIVEALKNKGIAVQYMVKENEGHGFQNEENKFEFYEAMERFLAEHIG